MAGLLEGDAERERVAFGRAAVRERLGDVEHRQSELRVLEVRAASGCVGDDRLGTRRREGGTGPARQLEPLRQFGEFINRFAWRAQREPAGPVLDELVQAIGYRAWLFDSLDDKAAADRWQNVTDFLEWVKKRAEEEGSTLLQLAQSLAILSQIDRKDADTDAVRMTTIHASKGLEFPHVFIVGCEEGLLPHRGDATPEGEESEADARRDEARIEEERRLMYVAVTRAQRSLTLLWCKARKRAREQRPSEPSRFLAEMQLAAGNRETRTVTADEGKARLANLKALLAQPKGGVSSK
jgi:ATP-dependent DNA helicase Rep